MSQISKPTEIVSINLDLHFQAKLELKSNHSSLPFLLMLRDSTLDNLKLLENLEILRLQILEFKALSDRKMLKFTDLGMKSLVLTS